MYINKVEAKLAALWLSSRNLAEDGSPQNTYPALTAGNGSPSNQSLFTLHSLYSMTHALLMNSSCSAVMTLILSKFWKVPAQDCCDISTL